MVTADFDMRTKWVDVIRNEKKTLTEAVKKCRTEWSSLFTDLHEAKTSKAGGQSEVTSEPAGKKPRRELHRVELTKHGDKICTFYNAGTCNYGKRCKFAHVCNVRGCGMEHMAADRHNV